MFGDFSYFNRQTVHEQYVPLGIGLIAQYAKQQFGDNINVSLFKSIDKFLDHATENPPDVVGLSIYFWNLAMNQYIVKCLRKMFGQDVIIILGAVVKNERMLSINSLERTAIALWSAPQ